VEGIGVDRGGGARRKKVAGWAGGEGEAQWVGGERLVGKEKKGCGWAKSPDGPAGCWAGWAKSEENSFPNKI
jgi:hypothetical protein